MSWIVKETPRGKLKYRMPNILEAYDILDSSGVGSGEKVGNIKLKKNVIQSMGSLVDYSEIENCSNYEDLLLMVEDMIGPLSEIADEIVIKTFEAFKKKNS